MPTVSPPYRPKSGESQIVEQLVIDVDTIVSVMNGQLEAGVNVKTGIQAAALDGSTASEGASLSLANALHTHVVQGVERLAAQPVTGNFVGRCYFNTADTRLYVCTDAGVPTFKPLNSLLAADLPVHASRHGAGNADPLPNAGVSADMLGRTVQVDPLGADVNAIGAAWTTVYSGTAFTLLSNQAVALGGRMTLINTHVSENVRVAWRIRDTSQSNAIVTGGPEESILSGSTVRVIPLNRYLNLLAGTHTFQLQACKGAANGTVNVLASETTASQAVTATQMEVLVG